MAPLIKALQATTWARAAVVLTGQHNELVAQQLRVFDVEADIDMALMKRHAGTIDLFTEAMRGFNIMFERFKPDMIIAQGDTTSVAATAMAAYYKKVPFGHLEAGLRSHNIHNPFPEEGNRKLAGIVAGIHFCPTKLAQQNLLNENIELAQTHVTGNTVIDALLSIKEEALKATFPLPTDKKIILVTCHRGDNMGKGIGNLIKIIKTLASNHPDLHFVYPVHPNPSVKKPIYEALSNHPSVQLCEPLDYLNFVKVMMQSYLILTDSGGIQEEAPALDKPVLVYRTTTERPEAVDSGAVKLVGIDPENVIKEFETLLEPNSPQYLNMSKAKSPYGDGTASAKIVEALAHYFSIDLKQS